MSIAYRPDRDQSLLLQKVQTIGYRQSNGLAEIDKMMQADPALVLVDIRLSPRSQNIQWTKTAFSKKYGKRYIWIKKLGNLNYDKENAPIEIAEPDAGIEQLLFLLQDHSILLLCGCEDYEICHRKVVYELLTENITGYISASDVKEVEATCFLPSSQFYVDDIWSYPDCNLHSKDWCHLATNGSIDDLHIFAASIGLKRKWFQDKAKYPHYDLTPGKRAAAIKHGALAVNHLELVKICFPKLTDSEAYKQLADRGENLHSEKQDQAFVQEMYGYSPTSEIEDEQPDIEMLQRLLVHYQETESLLYAENTRYREREAKFSRITGRLRQREREATSHLAAALAAMGRDPKGNIYNAATQELITSNQEWREAAKEMEQKYEEAASKIEKLEERYHCKVDDLIDENNPAKMVPLTAYQNVQQEIEIVNKLERNPKIKPGQEKFIRHVINATKYGKYEDAEGRRRLNLNKIAANIGMSPSTAQRGIQFCKEKLPQAFDIASYTEKAPDGNDTTRYYAKVKPEALLHLDTIEPLDFKQQGGDKTICALCGGKHVRIKIERKRTLICDDCNRENPPTIDTTISYEYPNDNYQKERAEAYIASKSEVTKNDALIITSDPPAACPVDDIPAAAELLYFIAGQHEEHIEMSRSGQKKYYTVNRSLSLEDLKNHLKGGQAKGALCQYGNGQTRALCWDADDITPWGILQDAAKLLAAARYTPLLEESPADRGGHLWVIFDALVDGESARANVYQIAPDLEKITEYWPAPASAKDWNRVRLPGAFYCRTGKYVDRDVKGWCKIKNASTGEVSNDGATAATLLLASQTSAAIITPVISRQDEQVETPTCEKQQVPTPIIEQPLSSLEKEIGYKLPVVDEKWQAKNGKITETKLYFAIMPEYAARWFNEHHTLEEIQPRERNGMALSPNGSERTASTTYRETIDGERYTDFSTHGMRSDGTRDTGDVLELACKIWQVSKSSLLFEATKEVSGQARQELESAAKAGKSIPAWLEEPCIITPAGRKRYTWLLAQSKKRVELAVDDLTERLRADVEQEIIQHEEATHIMIAPEKPTDVMIVSEESTEQISDYPHLKEGMQVLTPAGIAIIECISQCPVLNKPRCSVHTSTAQPNGSHFAAFHLSEVTPISQQTLL